MYIRAALAFTSPSDVSSVLEQLHITSPLISRFSSSISLNSSTGMSSGPAATSIISCNQRAVLVVPYVSQFALPPADAKLTELGQWSVHEIFRVPPNSMPTTKLCHSVSFRSEIDPVCLSALCSANLFRAAESESDYLLQLHAKTTDTRRCVSSC